MSERAAYSRVYWSVMDDPKFDGIREDARRFGSWSILLIVADMAWPAPAYVPSTVPRSCYRALVASGLVDEQSGGRFRIHGLDAERGRRREAATRPTTGRGPNGTRAGGNRDPNGEQDKTSLDEPRQDEPSLAESREESDILDDYYRLTARFPTSNTADWLTKIANEFGDDATSRMLATVHKADASPWTLLSRLENEMRSAAHAKERAALAKEKERLEADARTKHITPEQAEINQRRLAEITAEMFPDQETA
jgi:hypothetical protein